MDSFTLWKNICSSSILANVTFILFLNKCDILCTKLEAGQSFNKWVKSYNDEPNDAAHVSECEWFISAVVCEQGVTRRHVDLRNKLIAIYKSSSSKKGQLHVHVTCAIVSIIDRPIQGTRRLTKYLQDLDRMTNVIVRGESLKCSLLIRWLTAHSPSQSER